MNKVAVITGGATGIGKSAAKKLAQEGYSVAIIYNSSAASAEAVQKELRDEGTDCRIFKADVSDEE